LRKINKIIIHCTATIEGKEYSVDTIRQWHLQRGFKDVGYHYIIHLDGTIETGRPIQQIGAHCRGQNKNSIGICYVGGLDTQLNAKDTRTQEQKESLHKLINDLMKQYNLTYNDVYTHNHFANKDCPCFSLEQLHKEIQSS